MAKYNLPARAKEASVHRLKTKDGREVIGRVMEWSASKGYHTKFMEIPHWAFQVMIGEFYKTATVTTSEKRKKEILAHWQIIKA